MGHLRSAAKGGHANRGLVGRLRVCSCAREIDHTVDWSSIPCGTSTGRSRKSDRINAPYAVNALCIALIAFLGWIADGLGRIMSIPLQIGLVSRHDRVFAPHSRKWRIALETVVF